METEDMRHPSSLHVADISAEHAENGNSGKALLEENSNLKQKLADLLVVTAGLQEWIKAVPDDVVASLPAMPGIDGDWAAEVIHAAQTALRKD